VTAERQLLLAKVRYNRLIDMFLGLTTYSLQSHLRATAPGLGQVETDELYVGVAKSGQQFVIPVQAKGGSDQLGAVQIEQDLALCKHLFPELIARPVAVQFKKDEQGEVIVMFDLARNDDDQICIREERHYRLVPAESITAADFTEMARLSAPRAAD